MGVGVLGAQTVRRMVAGLRGNLVDDFGWCRHRLVKIIVENDLDARVPEWESHDLTRKANTSHEPRPHFVPEPMLVGHFVLLRLEA